MKITLIVESDDDNIIFRGESGSIEDLEENIIRKAEVAIKKYEERPILDEEIDSII